MASDYMISRRKITIIFRHSFFSRAAPGVVESDGGHSFLVRDIDEVATERRRGRR